MNADFPRQHPLRSVLADEVHARPYGKARAPARISFLACVSGEQGDTADRSYMDELCRDLGCEVPAPDARHFSADLGDFELKWERHSEFTTYQFRIDGTFREPFDITAFDRVPAKWRASIPGKLIAAGHIALEPSDAPERSSGQLADEFSGNSVTGSWVLGRRARVWSDYRLHEDGFARILVRDESLTGGQAGRLLQRLIEVEVYRMMAMLAFPLALEARPRVASAEAELSDRVKELSEVDRLTGERRMLDELTRLAARIESLTATNSYRFGASRAYYGLVRRCIEDIREERIEGLQPPGEFLYRRLVPAMETCDNVAVRQDTIARRIAQATELLRTRINVALEEQNQALLRSMDNRASMQMRLQQTVEGLSVVAISYYLLGIVHYALKAAEKAGFRVDADLATGIGIPAVAAAVWFGVRRIRQRIDGEATGRRQVSGSP